MRLLRAVLYILLFILSGKAYIVSSEACIVWLNSNFAFLLSFYSRRESSSARTALHLRKRNR
jgi:hypothetical protein